MTRSAAVTPGPRPARPASSPVIQAMPATPPPPRTSACSTVMVPPYSWWSGCLGPCGLGPCGLGSCGRGLCGLELGGEGVLERAAQGEGVSGAAQHAEPGERAGRRLGEPGELGGVITRPGDRDVPRGRAQQALDRADRAL